VVLSGSAREVRPFLSGGCAPPLSERCNHLVFAVGVGDTERRMVLGLKGLVVVGDVMVKVIQA